MARSRARVQSEEDEQETEGEADPQNGAGEEGRPPPLSGRPLAPPDFPAHEPLYLMAFMNKIF